MKERKESYYYGKNGKYRGKDWEEKVMKTIGSEAKSIEDGKRRRKEREGIIMEKDGK